MILVLAARQARAELWCGDGPGTALSHPCTDDDDNPAVSAAIDKYRDQWMELDGVSDVDESDTYHNRVPSIAVYVDSAAADSVKKELPASVDGIQIVIVPVEQSESDNTGHYAYGYGSTDPAEVARRARQQADQDKAQESYNSILRQYGERWDDLPGVLGIGAKWGDDGSMAIEITVQRELLSQARDEIPASVDGVPIVLTPDD